MDLIEIGKTKNVKQVEYLNNIREVGMGIIYGQTTPDVFLSIFEEYLDYVETPTEYLKTIKKVVYMIHMEECSPDDLLMLMGKHCPEIQYEEPQYEDLFEDDCGIGIINLEDDEILRNLFKVDE